MFQIIQDLFGVEVCRLNEIERAEMGKGERFNYKDFQLQRAIATPGQLSVAEARKLQDLVRQSDPSRPIIEIGTLFGWSTLVMTLSKQSTQKLITVDNYSWNPLGMTSRAHFAATSKVLAEAAANHNVEIVKMDKNQFFAQYTGPKPALFFCDADHTYEATLADLRWALAQSADIICGDDYAPGKHLGVTKAVDELGGPRDLVDELFVL